MLTYLNNITKYILFVFCIAGGLPGCTTSNTDIAASHDRSTGNTVSNPSNNVSEKPDANLQVVNTLPPPENTNQGAEILISQNDILEIDVFQVDELDKVVKVEPNGNISLPLIGAVQAVGKTVAQLEVEIERRYGANYLQNPEITVFMKESAGQRVTLDGEFVKPGIYATNSNSTLLQVIAQAEGLSKIADEKKLYVFREIGGKKIVANYSIKDIREGRRSDPRIFGGDVVIAFQSGTKVARQNLREALGIAVNATRVISPL